MQFNFVPMILGMALVTILPRALPAVLIKKMNFGPKTEKFLRLVPYTAMTAMIFPGLLTVDAARVEIGLAGALAAQTTLPVIGIPLKSSVMDGVDALLSTVQMPSGIPVATVAVDGAVNAALLAVQILAVEDASLAEKLDAHRAAGAEKALKANAEAEAEFNR